MDDFYAIAQTKEELINAKELVVKEATEKGLFLNPKKTQIVPLSHEFTILHTTYRIKGHTLIIRPDKASFTRERRKLKKLSIKVKEGKIPLKEFENRHKSWKCAIEKRFPRATSLDSVEQLYNNLREEINVNNNT